MAAHDFAAPVDVLLSGRRWDALRLDFGFPDHGDAAGDGTTVEPLPEGLRAAVRLALDEVAALTLLSFEERRDDPAAATLRYLRSDATETAYAHFPSDHARGGDSLYAPWLDEAPVGGYAHMTVLHETGHALGLKHPHDEDRGPGADPAWDRMALSVMSYRSHEGAPLGGYRNEPSGYAQSYMPLDVAALQALYGADFATRAGDTVYTVDPGTGAVFADSAPLGPAPAANRVFRTIWDGGGEDTYDLSAYARGVAIDLAPGAWVDLDRAGDAQAARLGRDGPYAEGQIANAFAPDARALIENAIGGAGADRLAGNAADNRLDGGAGDDALHDSAGSDLYLGGPGEDTLWFADPLAGRTVGRDGGFLTLAAADGATDRVAADVEVLRFADAVLDADTLAPIEGEAPTGRLRLAARLDDVRMSERPGGHRLDLPGGALEIAPGRAVALADATLDWVDDDIAAAIARLYQAAFDRAPDPRGHGFWYAQARDGLGRAAIAEAFAASGELGAAGRDAEWLAETVYRNALGRAPDDAGLAFWAGALDAGLPAGDLVLAFAEAEETRALQAEAHDDGFLLAL